MIRDRTSFRGLDPGIVAAFTEIVKTYHDGKSRGKEGSFVAADLNHLMQLYIMTKGTICHSDALPAKKNVIKNALKKLDRIQQQAGIDGFEEKTVKKVITEECVKADRIDPRTIKNYFNATMQLLEPRPDDLLLWNLDTVAHKTSFV